VHLRVRRAKGGAGMRKVEWFPVLMLGMALGAVVYYLLLQAT
jgi:hypothetical protein